MGKNVDEVMRTAYSLYEQGQFDEAIAVWREALRLDPNFAEAHYNIGSVLDDQDKAEEALAEWQKAVRIQSDYWKPYKAIGNALFVRAKKTRSDSDWRACLDAYRKAAEYGPDNARLHSDIGSVEWYLSDAKAAEQSLKTAICIDPNFQGAYRKLGRLYMEWGQWQNAYRAAYTCATLPEFDPDSIKINYRELFRGLTLPYASLPPLLSSCIKNPRRHRKAKFSR